MKEHFCPAEQSTITYQGECSWCGEREALAQTQEPWCMKMNGCKTKCEDCPVEVAQPQRTWVGLTNNELQPIADEYRILFGGWVEDFARAIEAKLKQKNGYAEEKNT